MEGEERRGEILRQAIVRDKSGVTLVTSAMSFFTKIRL